MLERASLNIGIAGLGRLGRRHAIDLAHRVPGARLIAACNPSPQALDWARAELGVGRVYQEFEQFVADERLDAVVLASPTTAHASQFEQALRAGKHVFVEKPLSLDVATCERLGALAAACPKQVALVGFERRFEPGPGASPRRDRPRRSGPALPRAFADLRHERSERLLREVLSQLRRHLQRLRRARHRSGALDAGQSQGHQGVCQRHHRVAPRPGRSTRMWTTPWPSSSSRVEPARCSTPAGRCPMATKPRWR